MKDYRVEVKVKNNLLYTAIMSNYKSVAEFCRIFALNPKEVGMFINMHEKSLYNKNDKLRPLVKKLCDSLGKSIGELFPPQYYLERNVAVREMDKEDLVSLESCPELLNLPAPDVMTDDTKLDEMKDKLNVVISTLSPREQEVINSRYYDEETYHSIADRLGVVTERVRQIEKRALSKLRHPCRSKYLRSYLYDTNDEDIKRNEIQFVNKLSDSLTKALNELTCDRTNRHKVEVYQENGDYVLVIKVPDNLHRALSYFRHAFNMYCGYKDTSKYYTNTVIYRALTQECLENMYLDCKAKGYI